MHNSMGDTVKRREVFGWAMYDVANSAYTTVVISLLYSVFFISHIVPEGSRWADSYWSLAIAVSSFICILLSPFIGVLCDYSGYKKRYLLIATLICAVFTAMLYLVQPGQIWLGVLLIILSNIPWMISETFCGALLTDISNRKNISLISGIGWGIGYLGGLLSIIVVTFGIVTADEVTETQSYISQVQTAMLFIAGYFLVMSLPTFLLVKERARPKPGFEHVSMSKLLKAGVERMRNYPAMLASAPRLFRFFIAFTIFSAGMAVIIKFVGIYANQVVNFSLAELTQLFIALQFSAMFGAIGFGYMERWLGPRKTLLLTLVGWMLAVLGIYSLMPLSQMLGMDPKTLFFLIGVVAGAGIGSTQSASRAIVGMLSPKDQTATMFGFWGMFGRLAVLLGMSFGFVSDQIGRQEALLLVLAFFVVGAILVARQKIDDAL